jgi:hypothetical protein
LVFLVGDGEKRTTWMIDRYEPETSIISYVVAAPSTLARIRIELRPANRRSIATVTYRKTALDDVGAKEVTAFVRHFPSQGPHWERAINAALKNHT